MSRSAVGAFLGVALREIVDGHDVRMLQPGCDPRFAQKPSARLAPATSAAGEEGDHLDGHLPVQRPAPNFRDITSR
ncbi:hypothetical protein MMF93_16255 [Streptomyces tubbatahanensis]|uniref:Uncharacterized protein n=1 Tax=Streptomyces tubbatahanensis TaxID=2923272 RepID=A0ABY3XU74_9ACTN|nr:hypothetical protein [Streptomyces tubbatahanensis]UNS97851.1 hypothetical protein MMF93_16255 [Streptomyces tubbatahanensis]